ncbi:MAG: hypothetical protein IPI16_16665 [Comamonadaceae bacterium]|nr:hypothetical protein [Comamonadaceae bacterium]
MYLLPKTETEARNTTVAGVLLAVIGLFVTPALAVVGVLCVAFGVIGWVTIARSASAENQRRSVEK